MAKLIYSYLASLDGYVADAAGDFGWAYPGEEVLAHINELERDVGTYLYGRTMYEMMMGWETDPSYAAASPGNAAFASLWQSAEKVVYSHTLEKVSTKQTRLERIFDVETVRDMKKNAKHDLAISGATFAATAMEAGLIDEFLIYLAPMIVGGGKKLFPEMLRQQLELIDERKFENGMVFLRYAVRQ